MPANTPRIHFTSAREPAYPRNDLVIHAIDGKFARLSTMSSSRSYPARLASIYPRLARLPFTAHDLHWAGFLAHPLLPALRLFSRKPVIADVFISLYDTLCFDRKKFKPASVMGRFFHGIDQLTCRLADRVVVDTGTHAEYFHQEFGVPQEKLRHFFIGCDENTFFPVADQPVAGRVLFYGSFLPVHGLETIVSAAHLLRNNPEIHFRFVGSGRLQNQIEAQIQSLNLTNITLTPFVPVHQLPQEIAAAEICLGGHFSAVPKAHRVIAGKTFQSLAMAKPTIVGDNPANRELLTHAESAWFCAMQDPQALSEAILHLHSNPAQALSIGTAGREIFLQRASYRVLTAEIQALIEELL